MEGYGGTTPVIKKVTFPKRGKFEVSLEDGRSIMLPVSRFPSLQKVPLARRNKYIIGNGNTIIWHDCAEVYHIQDFFGFPDDYRYKG
ncbi:DUF2442 domain-containing protein [Spirosoma sp. KCTC 42546]|uniref:DUF2442 domain-containing protein n=1 Tax=Spirosoma sp. KCTC 42546 TaxID=2520506 RepID=UPI00115A6CDC|nr:DUF2442 domain-containing protein [Spirosoma sp. KCTC 42546]